MRVHSPVLLMFRILFSSRLCFKTGASSLWLVKTWTINEILSLSNKLPLEYILNEDNLKLKIINPLISVIKLMT